MWGGGRLYIYLSLHRHHQNDSCIKVGSDESHFNVSLIVRGKVTRRWPQQNVEPGKLHRFTSNVRIAPLTDRDG